MYNAKLVVPGILIFIGIFLSPIVYNLALGSRGFEPELVIDPQYTKCIESREFMSANHMDLLDEWRNSVVREGNRIYTAKDGTQFNMSLTNTCLDCHDNKATFCDRCHNYAAVDPACWDCHIVPEETR